MNRAARLAVCLALVGSSSLAAQGYGPAGAGEKKEKAARPYWILARVVDVSGAPIVGAGLAVAHGSEIELDGGATRNQPHFKTDTEGRLSALVERVEGKSASFLLSAKGKVCVQLIPRTTDAKFKGKDVAKADFGTLVLRDGFDIRGLIRSKNGKPVVGARVVATGVLARMMNTAARRAPTSVREFTRAVTDEKGIVRLYGIPRYGVSVEVTAEGYFPKRIAYLNRHVPLVATLQRGGTIVGRVLDAAGEPVNGARVRTHSENPAKTSTQTTAEDGAFRMDVPGPGRYRISCYAPFGGAARYTYLWSKVLQGPQPGLDLRFDAGDDAGDDAGGKAKRGAKAGSGRAAKAIAKAAKPGLVVKVTDKKTGIAIREVRATALWYAPNMWQHNPGYLERHIQSTAKVKTDEQGKLTLREPRQGQPTTGRLMVVAKGYAPVIIKDLEWDEDAKSHEVAVQLELESVLAGVVKDAAGKPVPGATVFVTANPMVIRNYVPPPMRRKLDDQQGKITTNEKGEFRFRSLGAGKHHVYFGHPKYADADAVEIDLRAHDSKIGLTMTLPRGATIFGKLVGVTPKLGWRVRIQRMKEERQNFGAYYSLDVDQASEFAPVQKDGTFEIEGLARANYILALLMPGGEGQIEVPIEPLRVRSKDLHREFDIGEEMPGTIQGKVGIRGAPLPPGRLLLLAVKHGLRLTNYYSNRPNLMGHPTVVGRDGTFSLRVPEGKYYLQLVDLKTAVTLYQGRTTVKVKPTRTTSTDLAVDLAPVTLTLVPDTEGSAIAISRIEIRVAHPPLPGDPRANMVLGGSDSYRGIGIEIEPGTTEVSLILPCIETKLLARSDSHNLDPKRHARNFPAQGEVDVHPETAKSNRVEIRVAEPEIDVTNNSR
jgi:uncharacterized GH25 family protein